MEKDIKGLTKNLRLAECFKKKPELDTPDYSRVKNKSNFCPPLNRNSTLELVIEFLQ